MEAGELAPTPRRPRPPAGLIGVLVASLAGLATFGTLSGLLVPKYQLSTETQHHGVLDSGTISSVTNTESKPGHWSAAVRITLDRPVDGVTSTTLQVGSAVSSPAGTPETVLVDPQDPGYAEHPGHPTYPLLGLVLLFLLPAGVSALLFGFAVWRLAVIRSRNRGLPPAPAGRHRRQPGRRGRDQRGSTGSAPPSEPTGDGADALTA
ncbi:MAG TPA: hypothetical protein VMU95_34255 [Trebonia sp.]|nr:hypothetical protein [Trebonia sp.]